MSRKQKEVIPLTWEEQQVIIRYVPLAERIAKSIAKNWEAVPEDEVTSELYAWLCNNVKYIISCESQTKEKNIVLETEGKKPVGDYRPNEALKNAAIAFCAKETKIKNNIDNLNNDNYYTKKNVYEALEFLFVFDFSKHEIEGTDKHLSYQIMLDINNAYLSLNKINKKYIEQRYKEGLSYSDIAEYYNISLIAAEKRIERAVGFIYNNLAGSPIFWTNDNKQDTKGIEDL